jgi:hypothetical protein
MAAQLSRPGVEVIQVFRAVSPTIITPTLVPNVVGVCKQIVEVLESDGAGGNVLNSDALIVLPAAAIAVEAVGDPGVYTGLDGLNLIFSANGMPSVIVTFSDPLATGLTPASVVAQVQAAITAAGATGVVADLVEQNPQWQLRTVGTGDFQTIFIDPSTDLDVLTAFGFGAGKTYAGLSSYSQYIVRIPQESFPDPRKNLAELGIETETVRVFLATGNATGLQEAHRTQTFLRNGSVADPAFLIGSVDITGLTYPSGVTGKIITLDHNGTQLTHTVGSPGSVSAFVTELATAFATIGITAIQTVSPSGHLEFKTTTGGQTETITAVSGNLLATVGITVSATDTGESISSIDDGNGDAVTPLINLAGAITIPNFTSSPTAAVLSLTGTYPLAADGTLILSGGDQPQTIELTAGQSAAQVFAAINKIVAPAAGGLITASSSGSTNVTLTHSETGTDSVIQIIGGTALTAMGAAAGFTRGVPCKPLPGDELWIDGVFYANIVQVAPGGQTAVLKVDRQVAISTNIGTSWFIIAKNLTGSPIVGRPTSELTFDLTGAPIVKQELLRDTTGARVDAKAQIYLAYQAVRRDVSPLAAQPGILRFDDTTQLGTALSPITTDNPLALGLFFALLNAPGVQVTGLGVDESTDVAPFGTVEAFTRAAEYLESMEVYAIAPLTHDATVHQVFDTHVTVMSAPENKGERIVLINPSIPTTKNDTLVASGTNGDRLTTTTFDTKISNLTGLVLNAGINPVGTIPVSAGLFLSLASSTDRFSISAISGSVITTRTSFAAGENDDGFYTTDTLPLAIAETFAVKVRGAALSVAGIPDKDGIALTLQQTAQTYGNRRVWMIEPDKCAATLEGLEQIIDGFYMCAAISGMIGQQPPQQSFTNFPMSGFTRVIGSNDTFKQAQINVMAAGGVNVIVQDAPGAPLISQFALTTDMTSVETRTDSITKVVDFTAKFLRKGIKNFIGRFNITQGLLDTLSSVIQGLLGFLVENGVLIGADLNNIIQDEDNPDTVLVEVRLDVPFPCNYIKLTLQV